MISAYASYVEGERRAVDDAIVAEWRALVRRWDYETHDQRQALWLHLARKYRRPIREIKALIDRARDA